MSRCHLLLVLDSRQPLDPGVLLRRSTLHVEAFSKYGLHLLTHVVVNLDCLSGIMVEPVDNDVRVMVLPQVVSVGVGVFLVMMKVYADNRNAISFKPTDKRCEIFDPCVRLNRRTTLGMAEQPERVFSLPVVLPCVSFVFSGS